MFGTTMITLDSFIVTHVTLQNLQSKKKLKIMKPYCDLHCDIKHTFKPLDQTLIPPFIIVNH